MGAGTTSVLLSVTLIVATVAGIVIIATNGGSSEVSEWMRALPSVRTVTGVPNHPRGIGGAGEEMPRTLPAAPIDVHAPDVRRVSDELFGTPALGSATSRTTQLLWLFGQFIDHTFVATDPGSTVNKLTPFIDGSTIYGSTAEQMAHLRAGTGGMLREDHGLLPGAPGRFEAGDERRDEHAGLIAMHTLWLRNHNWWAAKLAPRLGARASDTAVFEAARACNTGELQAVIEREWLPALLGGRRAPRITTYNPAYDPRMSLEFTTSCFRFGHSMVAQTLDGLDLVESFRTGTQYVRTHGVESLLAAAANERAMPVDTHVVDAMRTTPNFTLAILNLQRGRERRLASYAEFRSGAGLAPARHWLGDVTSDTALATTLTQLYGADPAAPSVDSFVGMLAEDHEHGSELGPTMGWCVARQFERSMRGDAYYYKWFHNNDLLRSYRGAIATTSMRRIIERNTAIVIPDARKNLFVSA